MARSGDVIFLGEFDSGLIMRPDVSPDAMSRHVPVSFETAKPAEWVNGAVSSCPPVNLYALDFEGFPDRSAGDDSSADLARP